MLLYVPTYGRTERPLTLQSIGPEWLRRTVIVCPREEASFYRHAFPQVAAIDTPKVSHIAEKRAWIFKNAKHPKIMMLDDDLQFAVRAKRLQRLSGFRKSAPDWNKLRAADPMLGRLVRVTGDKKLGPVFDRVALMLDHYRHGGISQRFMNQIHGPEFIHTYKATHAIAFHVPTVLKHCKVGRVYMFEDLDYTIQLLRAGFDNAILTWAATNDPHGFNAPGGASADRKLKDIDDGALLMEKLHPGIVRAVRRESEDASWKGNYRIAVQWKKALIEGEFI